MSKRALGGRPGRVAGTDEAVCACAMVGSFAEGRPPPCGRVCLRRYGVTGALSPGIRPEFTDPVRAPDQTPLSLPGSVFHETTITIE
ncbi:hypothetical protein JMUB6875_66730 [Nocardia sp. JMUB6875]